VQCYRGVGNRCIKPKRWGENDFAFYAADSRLMENIFLYR
jgi:hypothetical protein